MDHMADSPCKYFNPFTPNSLSRPPPPSVVHHHLLLFYLHCQSPPPPINAIKNWPFSLILVSDLSVCSEKEDKKKLTTVHMATMKNSQKTKTQKPNGLPGTVIQTTNKQKTSNQLFILFYLFFFLSLSLTHSLIHFFFPGCHGNHCILTGKGKKTQK